MIRLTNHIMRLLRLSRALLDAVRALAFMVENNVRRAVNYLG